MQETSARVTITDTIISQDLEGIRLYIGISPTGIRIYQAGDMVRMNSFNWAKVLQVTNYRLDVGQRGFLAVENKLMVIL